MSTPFRLLLPWEFMEEMIAQARTELPNECCGLLAGRLDGDAVQAGRVAVRYPLVNSARSPTQYLSEAPSLFAAHRDMRRLGLEVLAIYHSHPTSPPVPSRTDLDQNNWPGVVHFIISLLAPEPEVRGWRLSANAYEPADWELVHAPSIQA